MAHFQITRQTLHAHESARYRQQGFLDAEHRAERSCNAWEELTARASIRCRPLPCATTADVVEHLLSLVPIPRGSPMNHLSFSRNQYAARVARLRKDLPARSARELGERACLARESKGGEWPARVVLGEREYKEEVHAREIAEPATA